MVYSLVTVNNNVSLLSITIAPSAYIASVTLAFVFIYLYVIQISWKPTLLPNLQSSPLFRRPSRTLSCSPTMTAHDPLDHLDASLQDFEPTTPAHPHFGYPSHHSGLRSDDTESDLLDPVDSPGGYSPPAWRRLGNGNRDSGFWRKTNDILGTFPPRGSRASSPAYDDADLLGDDVLDRAVRTRLPTGSMSPDKRRSPSPAPKHEETTTTTTLKLDDVAWKGSSLGEVRSAEGPDNYIRFALRAEVQQRTEPIERAVHFLRARWAAATKSWSSLILSVLVAVLSATALRNLFQPATPRPVPDLVKVAGIARSFEPLIYFSENGASQVGDLQATGVAVWDLGESVRSSNMTSAPIIVKELDELSDSLKTLAVELTKFFANVDGDIDGILIVMDWARRELAQVQQLASPPALTSAFDNVHNLLSRAGVLETAAGGPTRVGALVTALFGLSSPQRTQQALERTFHEFLSVLEEAIEAELQHSLALFGLFEAIDRQFLNLARTVVREASAQEDMQAEVLASLWTRILGANAGAVAKFARNKLLLQTVREKTVRNKGVLVEHNGRLLTLKANLESLRRKLVSPLVRSVNSSTLTLDEQVRGLETVGGYLEGVRARQKGKLMAMLYGARGTDERGLP
ncbi:hypothetical protein VD0002_g8927 [Verticillium dahliae]|uniref:Uncharacterized protein n=1 Tax=Verticillium dahliae TaxID=27337 RepID=A0AA45ANX0_VERDA|nr:hypothetical protein BJF96_g2946 [Verticillium dahliae]PNH58597.1 hypothetical protein VD0002_g8927 [Verticillium dahliae]